MRRLPVLIFWLSLFLGAVQTFAQKKPKLRPQPSPTPPIESKSEGQEPVRVFTEEVRLSVAATDQYGHYDPSLEVDDVLVLEDGQPQQIRSVRHIPANVLLILDTADPYFGGQKVAALLSAQVPHLPHQYQSPFWNPVITALFNEYTKCMLGKQTPAQTITNAVTQAKAIIARLNEHEPDLIVIELGDGILGGYSVDTILDDAELRDATAAIIFCATDYVGAWGGIELLRRRGIKIDLIAGSVTDSQMGQDYVEREFGVPAANARRNGERLFDIVNAKVSGFRFQVSSS